MKTQTEPRTGDIFECVKNNRQHSAVRGKFYLYDSGELKTYTKRNVTCLANGDEMLELPGVFEPAKTCPFCGMEAAAMTVTQHDGVECAAAWDARVKNYCQECSADTINGKCPHCDDVAEPANASQN